MGADLTEADVTTPHGANLCLPAWLDPETASLVRAIICSVARYHPDLRAALLYGSVARHDERPLDDAEPSDVDLLLLFDLKLALVRIPYERDLAISRSIGLARERHADAPREVQVAVATNDLADWDPTFVENVARDGILLWASGPLPASLSAIPERPSESAIS